MNQLTGKIILGTVQFGIPYGINNNQGTPSECEIFQLLDTAYANGIRCLDTADAYGNAIAVIANYHRQTANRFAINNKFSAGNTASFLENIVQQLKALQVPFFEHYLFHRPDDMFDRRYIDMMTTLKEKGLAKNIGVSVYTNEQFMKAVELDVIDSIQLPFNLLDNNNKRSAVLEQAKVNQKKVHARSVFLQGLFFMDSQQLPVKLSPLSVYLGRIHAIAKEAGLSIHELALQYVVRNNMIDKVLIGVDNSSHLNAAINAINMKADEDIFALIDSLDVKEPELLNPMNWK